MLTQTVRALLSVSLGVAMGAMFYLLANRILEGLDEP
jgi:hypothetical protein